MRGFWALFIREFQERRAVLVAAAAAALIPILLPLAPNVPASSVADIRELSALVIGLGLSWIMALFLGSGMIGAEIAQGRFSFSFSRPVGASAIWFAKVAANWLLVVSTELIVFLPAVLVFGSRPFFALNSSSWWNAVGVVAGGHWAVVFVTVIVPFLLVLVAHALGTIWRARSPWMILDLALFSAVAVVLWHALAGLALEVPAAALFLGLCFVSVIPVVLLIAGWVQVVRGRTDLTHHHRALSKPLWIFMAVFAAGVVVAAGWILDVGPDDLLPGYGYHVWEAPKGPWAFVFGQAAGRFGFEPRFLVNRESHAYVRIRSRTTDYRSDLGFSEDGSRAAWYESVDFKTFQLMYAELGGDRPIVRETLLSFEWRPSFRLSKTGRRVALYGYKDATLSFFELESGTLLFATRWDQWRLLGARFHSESLFRVTSERWSGWGSNAIRKPIEITEIDIESGHVETTGVLEPVDGEHEDDEFWFTRYYEDEPRNRFLLVDGWSDHLHWTVRNSRTGEVQADFGVMETEGSVMWTSDGRLVRVIAEDDQAWIEVRSVERGTTLRWPLGPAEQSRRIEESSPGEVTVYLTTNPVSFKRLDPNIQAWKVDLDTGETTVEDVQD